MKSPNRAPSPWLSSRSMPCRASAADDCCCRWWLVLVCAGCQLLRRPGTPCEIHIMISLHDRGMACHGMAAATGGVASCHVSQSSCLRRVHGASACLPCLPVDRCGRRASQPHHLPTRPADLLRLQSLAAPGHQGRDPGARPIPRPRCGGERGGDGDAKLLLLR